MKFFSQLANPFTLKRLGILGMNERNIAYISRYNPRRFYPLVDNKLHTKKMALSENIKVPKLIGVIQEQHHVQNLAQLLKNHQGFCIKPACGSGGKGIVVIQNSEQGRYIKSNKTVVTLDDLKRHVSNILAGLFSLGGRNDAAMIEELVHFDPIFSDFSFEGVPDTRIIVFKGIPIMAMMRLPTANSDGKANLYQGAVGVGICITSGQAVKGVYLDKTIHTHPDTKKPLASLKIPHWDQFLVLAAGCYEMSGLGYLGADLVLDKHQGPMLLELNARSGLSIQLANGKGLLPRLQLIEQCGKKIPNTVHDRIKFAKNHFLHNAL